MSEKKCKGMTLVELIAAIAILGIVLVSTSTLILIIGKYNNIMKYKISNSAINQKFIEYYKSYDFSTQSDKELDKIKSNKYCEQYIYLTKKSSIADSIEETTVIPVNENNIGFETYDRVVSSHPPANPSQKYDYVIKVVFTHKDDDMIAIDVTVWDSKNKDECKVEYVTLRSIKYENL